MGLITKEVEVGIKPQTMKHYENLGYTLPKIETRYGICTPQKTKIIVNIEDLPDGSHTRVDVQCDHCGDYKNIEWRNFIKSTNKNNGKYYCCNCAKKLYGGENLSKSKLKNSKSFKQWCVDNNKEDILDRWDYNKNTLYPNKICYYSKKKFWFLCTEKCHSRLVSLADIISNNSLFVNCERCNSFEKWCIDNSREDVLARWDHELNKCNPSDISFCSTGEGGLGYWFKCPRGLHKSELHRLADLVKYNISFKCRQCNSFAQWGIDNIGEDFLERYWDYDKNKISPWDVECKSSKYKVWIKCQKKDYHGSYDIIPLSFVAGNRCRYCVNYNGEVHKLDSLGMVFPKILSVWSDKNKKSPYEYSPTSGKSVWWKCHEGKHSDYYRKISRSKTCGFCCPECQNSKGEDKISQYLINNNFIRIKQEDFDKISDIEKYKNKYYITQKIYNGLMGVGNGYLRYDFYLPQYNLLIEYQGQQHEKFIKGIYSSKKDFEIQQEHDRRKREYAQNNNIKLLEIWYWDYDKIESILEKEIVNSLLK